MNLRVIHRVSESEKHNCSISTIISVDGSVLTGGDDGILKCWSAGLNLISEKNLNTGGLLSIASDSSSLYSCASDQNIHAWDIKSYQPLGQVTTTLNIPLKLFVEPVSNILWAGDSIGNVAQFTAGTESGKWELAEEVWDLLVTCNPNYIYTARDRDIAVTELILGSTQKRHAVLRGTVGGRYPIVICGDKLCCLSREGKVLQVHDNNVSNKFKLLHEIPIGDLILNAAAVGGDGFVYVAGYDSKVTRLDLATGTVTSTVDVGSCVNALTRAPQGVYAALTDGQVLLVGS